MLLGACAPELLLQGGIKHGMSRREMGVLGRAQCDDGAGGSALEKLQSVSFLGNI